MKKRLICLLLAALMAASLFTVTAFAYTETAVNYEASTTTSLKVRKGPGTSYDCLMVLSQGTKVTIVAEAEDSRGDTWCKRSEGGWMCAAYLTKKVSGTDTTPTEPESTEPEIVAASGNYQVIIKQGVNVREKPSTSAKKLRTLQYNDKVVIAAETKVSNTTWVQLTTGGWVVKSSLKCLDKTDDTPTTPDDTVPVVPSTDDEETTPDDSDGTPNYYVNASKGVNERYGAGTKYSVKKALSYKTLVCVVAEKTVDGTTWCKLSDGGWVSKLYLTAIKGANTKVPTSVVTTSEANYMVNSKSGLYKRTGPGKSYSQAGLLKYKTKVTVVSEKKNGTVTWAKLSDGTYVDKAYLKSLSGSSDKETSVTISGTKYKVTVSGLRTRRGAGTSYDIVGSLRKNQIVYIVKTDKDKSGTQWGKLENGTWVCMKYLKKA